MSLTKFTDLNGKPLRADYFPVRLDRSVPRSAGYAQTTRKATYSPPTERPKPSPSRLKALHPPTYMIVDYNFDAQRDSPKNQIINDPVVSQSSEYEVKRTPVSTLISRIPAKKPHTASHPLYSSFLMKQQVHKEETASGALFKKEDAETQTIANLDRLELPGVRDYQTWTNEVLEPFMKDLRKQLKNCRPASIEDYIIAYCEAKKSGLPVPDTTMNIGGGRNTDVERRVSPKGFQSSQPQQPQQDQDQDQQEGEND